MNRENILKVAQAIEDAAKPDAKPEFGFNMAGFRAIRGYWPDRTGHDCGTTCCIAGWAAGTGGDGWQIEARARERLGLTISEANRLFFAEDAEGNISTDLEKVEPAHAVAVLRHLAETGVVDWTVGAPAEAA